MSDCPNCGSARTRRGGTGIWMMYVAALALAIPGVLLLHLNAGIVGAILIGIIVVAHLVFATRVCLDCGHQWRAG